MAIEKMQKTKCRVKVVDTVEDVDASKKLKTLANITSFLNFQHEETGLRVWQAYAIENCKKLQFV